MEEALADSAPLLGCCSTDGGDAVKSLLAATGGFPSSLLGGNVVPLSVLSFIGDAADDPSDVDVAGLVSTAGLALRLDFLSLFVDLLSFTGLFAGVAVAVDGGAFSAATLSRTVLSFVSPAFFEYPFNFFSILFESRRTVGGGGVSNGVSPVPK